MAVVVTFIGGPETGGVDTTVMGNDITGTVTFPLRVPVVIDPDKAKNAPEKDFLTHLTNKLAGNRFFTVEQTEKGKEPKGAEVAKVMHTGPRPKEAPPKPDKYRKPLDGDSY